MTSPGKLLILLFVFVESSHACSCDSLSWASCDESSCQCYISVGKGQRQIINCTAEISKCFLMKAAMYHLHHPSSSQNQPMEAALPAGEELYDPDCESSGLFKARQCSTSGVCWCVDSTGVRISDNSDETLKCEKPVEKNWVHNRLNHREIDKPLDSFQLQSVIASAIQDQMQVSKIKVKVRVDRIYKISQTSQNRALWDSTSYNLKKYDVNARLITLDLENDIGDRIQDLSGLGYYMEKEVEEMTKGTGQKLETEKVVVYYEEEEREEEEEEVERAPTDGTQRLMFGILTVTVVVILAAPAGLLVLFLIRRRQPVKYEKAQTSEMEDI